MLWSEKKQKTFICFSDFEPLSLAEQEQIRLKNIRNVYGRCLWYRLRLLKPQQNIIPTVKKIILLAGWALFLFLAYKVSKTDREYQEYNPYEVLHLDPGASVSEIKKQYRALSLKYHPDKGGDEVMFMRIAKAYAALTDEESRKNWEEFGNPDGPQATSFGIALPAWIVDQKNSILVLLVYGLAFMVILPVVVGSWWYRSIRYSGDQILIRTTQIYTYFVYKTRNMDMKRLIMVLAGASEFDPQYNKDATSRPADNTQIPQLIREIGGINLKKNEPPLTCPYSLKARVLLLTHLARMKVPEALEEDQQFILKKSPALLQEMINVICQLIIMARSREVLDDEDSNNITVGSLVTVLVTLTRQTMAEVFEKEQSICAAEEQPAEDGQGDVNKIKSKGWQQKNKGTKKASKSKKKKPLKKKPLPPSLQPPKQQKQKQANGEVVVKEEEEEISDKGSESEEEETNRDSQSEKDDGSDRDSDREQDEKQNKDDEAEWQELQQSIQRKERALLETKSKITHPVYSLFFPEEKQEWWWLYIADRKEQMLICMPYHVCTLKDKEEVELKFPAPGKPGNYQYTVYLRSDSYMGLDQIKPLKLEVHEAKPVPENHPQWDTAIEGDEDQEDSEGFEDSFEEEEEEEEDDD
ncbi:translocation protein SEC63 homolog isoform X2 [Apteryx rowi]|uniref:translocation protein SEC63 homolog isoform X2 n=1 Tax=Apteryx rowi TaxID=308060 RepID=UPI000E1D1945|nr:translocation protein SEC63 homolog isoform X2 [Apteryx rowi]